MAIIQIKIHKKEIAMLNNNMKNIVVLKNLPSNLVDEAIVILKNNKNAKKLERVQKNIASNNFKAEQDNSYVIKEAESVISSYIAKMEKGKKVKISKNNIETKYRKIKIYSIFVSVILAICLIRTVI